MLRLQIYPDEFLGLVHYLSARVNAILPVPILDRSLYDQILVEYWQKANPPARLPRWTRYANRKRYAFTLPLSVARLLHQEMQYVALTNSAQAFLTELDRALIDEANVYAVRL